MEKTLTVVVPTYNMERYLRRCLDSLIVHDTLMNLLEVLVINDGSRDSSSAIAHEYQDRYPQTFRVIDKENGNYGSCVNRGLDEATGKYFRLLDADDRFDNEVFTHFMMLLFKTEADMVLTPFCFTYVDDENRREYKPFPERIDFGKVYAAGDFDFKKMGCEDLLAMHGVTYRREILNKVHLRNQTGISYTDTEYVYFPLVATKSILPWGLYLYLYTREREGQTVSPEARARSVSHYYKVARRIFDDYVACKENKTDDALRQKQLLMLYRIVSSYYGTVLELLQRNEEEEARMRSFLEEIKAYTPELLAMLRKLHCRKILYYFRTWERSGKYITDQPYLTIYNLLTKLKRNK